MVMVGLFKPIVRKFEEAGVPLEIFDMIKADNRLTEMNRQKEDLKTGRCGDLNLHFCV